MCAVDSTGLTNQALGNESRYDFEEQPAREISRERLMWLLGLCGPLRRGWLAAPVTTNSKNRELLAIGVHFTSSGHPLGDSSDFMFFGLAPSEDLEAMRRSGPACTLMKFPQW